MRERADFQVNDDKTTQPPVKEQQVHPKPFVPDSQPLLSRDEREFVAEFEQKSFKVSNQGILQVALGVFILQIQEFENQRVADFFISRHSILRFGLFSFEQHHGFVLRQRCALVKLRVDLPVKLPDRPAARQRFPHVKLAGECIPNAQQADVVRPRQRECASHRTEAFNCLRRRFSNHRLDNF